MTNANYIETVGESDYTEEIQSLSAEIILRVSGTRRDDTMVQVAAFYSRAVDCLISSGLSKSEVQDGGLDLLTSWFQKKKKDARHKIIVQSTDSKRLVLGLQQLDELSKRRVETLEIRMRHPVFKANVETKNIALQQALADAKQKANALTKETGTRLGKVLKIKEEGSSPQSSGFFGDEDWWGFRPRLRAKFRAESHADEPSPDLEKARRNVVFRCRVRFELLQD